ncbi:MAG: putative zinc metalloprotease [Tenericutes bacterium ADurb.BinA155]|nr:MAG: putative zinc metalloprotease [Tenericutes bacterium ADurb.BinA155]
MQVFLNILIMIVILAVLISIHEAGHLSMAKLFKVYCFEYSIGFGPKILHVKRKKGETYFSIRAIPFGGYCSMYGEPGVVPDDVKEIPPASRSLEAIAKWKKIIILVAGVVLNYLLGLILLFVSVSCFPQYYFASWGMYVDPNLASDQTNLRLYLDKVDYQEGTDFYNLVDAKKGTYAVKDYALDLGVRNYPSLTAAASTGTILDSDVTICDAKGTALSGTYVALYSPSNLTSAHSLASYIYLYNASSVDPASVSSLYTQAGVTHFPDLSKPYTIRSENCEGYTFKLDLSLIVPTRSENKVVAANQISVTPTFTVKSKVVEDPGCTLAVNSAWNSWSQAWEEWAYYVPECNAAIINGLLGLFNPSNWSSLSGIVGMTAAVGTYSAMGGAAAIFLYAGLISINLAIFNLLPFPGLDGWQILVTLIEGIANRIKRKKWERARDKVLSQPVAASAGASASVTAPISNDVSTPEKPQEDPNVYKPWKIPDKVKGIVSYVGLGLLLLLMVAVMIKDIIALF